MDTTAALLDSWDRQARIVNAVATLVNESNKNVKPSQEGWPLYEHLAHIQLVRKYWMGQLDEQRMKSLADLYNGGWSDPIDDLGAIRKALDESGRAVREAVEKALKDGKEKVGGYDNPVLYLQHMVWHDGWHVGLIFLGLRNNGEEPPEEWEEKNVWGEWRTE